MIFKRKSLTLLTLALILTGCASHESGFEEYPYQTLKQEYPVDKTYNINTLWWTNYHDVQLNQLVETALRNNIDLATGAINVNQALYQANLVGADLVPTFSGSLGASASKNIKNGSNSVQNFQAGANLSYTLDLWGRLRDSASAAEWTYKATGEDLEASKLTIINSVIDSYFHLKYLQEIRTINLDTLKNYQQIHNISLAKQKYGLVSDLDVVQSQQSIESTQNAINSLDLEIKTTEQTLKNILNYQPGNAIYLSKNSLLDTPLQNIDVNIPVSTIANRPDLKADEYRLLSSFKDRTAVEKTIYPDITLGSALSSSGTKFNNALNVPVASGNVSISLPFLDWNRVKNNIKISQAQFEKTKLGFEKDIVAALNEIDTYYYTYNNYTSNFQSVVKQYDNNKRISSYYKARYDQGIAEMSDWLNALQSENSAKQSIVQAKYQLLNSENKVYQAMAGKYNK